MPYFCHAFALRLIEKHIPSQNLLRKIALPYFQKYTQSSVAKKIKQSFYVIFFSLKHENLQTGDESTLGPFDLNLLYFVSRHSPILMLVIKNLRQFDHCKEYLITL